MKGDPRKINKALKYCKSHTIEIGILGDGGSITTSKGIEKEITVLQYGIYQEFGTKNMPPRPFIGNALTSNKTEIHKYLEKLINGILSGKADGRETYIKFGLYLQGLVMQSIASASTWSTPLSEATIKSKQKNAPNRVNQPLILDGFLIKSIRFKIVKNDASVYKSDWTNFNV